MSAGESTLQQRICLILREQGLKKVDFAQALGISANYVSLLAAGKKTALSQTLARLIQSTYGYRAEWVLSGAPPQRLDELQDVRTDTILRLNRLGERELRAVSQFLAALEAEEAQG